MPRILVLFGTTDGHTAKIAKSVRDALETEGCSVDLVNAAEGTAGITPEPYDGVIVAASVRAGKYQRPVLRWVRAHAPSLNTRPSAFLSVCLGILEHNVRARTELDAILHRFLHRTGWHPAVRKFVAGATPFTRYNLLTRWVMRRIVTKAIGYADTTRDTEYTDWDDLRSFSREFARLAVPHELHPAHEVTWS